LPIVERSLIFSLYPHRAVFRHVPHVPRHRAPTKWGAPTNEGPHAKVSDKRFSIHKDFNVLGAGHLEWGPLEWTPLSKGSFEWGSP
jgi:hypothetical protein